MSLTKTPGGIEVPELAWLAGIWDGEGSVGLSKSKTTYVLTAQLSHTDRATVVVVLDLLGRLGVLSRGYTYQERDPSRHRDAHYVRVNGVMNVRKLALAVSPHSVTKRRHWQLAIEWADSRIAVAGGVDEKGHLKRGGTRWMENKYSPSELTIASTMAALNRRGPAGRESHQQGRIM